MTNFYKAYCRVFQKVMFVAECFMPWGEPFMLTGPGSIRKLPNLIKEKGLKKVLIVTDKGLTSLGLLNSLYEEMDKAVEFHIRRRKFHDVRSVSSSSGHADLMPG